MADTVRAVGPVPGRRPGTAVDRAHLDRAHADQARRAARELADELEVFRARAQALRRQLEVRRTWLAADLASSAQCLAGQRAVSGAVTPGAAAAGAAARGATPAGRDGGDGAAVAGPGTA